MSGNARSEEGRPEEGRPSALASYAASWQPLDQALAAYRAGRADAAVRVRTDVGGDDEMRAAYFLRRPADMGAVERAALEGARGRVLDLGAGAGAFALPLARRGLAVTALEILPAGRALLAEGGIADVRDGGVEAVAPDERFDTVLAMMNGVGLCGTVSALPMCLAVMANVLAPEGQILADSTDPRSWGGFADGRYAGEVHMQLDFEGTAGPPFPFLFVDDELLEEAARLAGLACHVVVREPDGRYLARLTREWGGAGRR
ncbi:MAG: methyltransferase domain-containing protein [Gemmatimonadetes bacterium]|nr:methyltransferase domain-containing protein [Gemmatimonadota bacterium]